MSFEHATLADFVQQTWTLAATTSFQELLRLVQQWPVHTLDTPSTDRIVLVDEQNQAMGLFSVAQLLAKHWADAKHVAAPSDPLLSLAEAYMHSILTLPANLTPGEFWQQWQALPDATDLIWGVVHPDSNQFLGLLDISRLRQDFAQPDPVSAAVDEHQIPAWSPQVLAALVGFIEQLPTPLLLQKHCGQVIARNLVWRQHIDPMVTPSQMIQAPTEDFLSSPLGDWGGRCHPGETPNSLVCSYSLQNGEEQIWQFYKLPVALLNSATAPLSTTENHVDLPLDWTAEPTELWITMAQDVTDTHHLIPELQAKNADLMLLNSLNEDFLSELSHDIKTPLTALVGLSNVLREKRLGNLSERQTQYLQLIYQKSQQLMLIMNDLLDLTQIRTQRLALYPEPLDSLPLCQDAITQALRRQSIEQGTPLELDHEIQIDIDPGLTEVVADPNRLRQILVLLLFQALGLTTATDRIGIRVADWGAWIAWTVWDTGTGIPPHQQHLVFQTPVVFEGPPTQFYQTRLGLILARRLAQYQGGDITFLAAPQQTNQLTLLLPRQSPHEPMAVPRASTPSALVLVIAAVPTLITALEQILTPMHARVVVARSGPEALEKSRQLSPQLIFLHLPLPYISGWDVLTLLKRDPTTRSIAVVILGEVPESQQIRFEVSALPLPLQPEAVQACLAQLEMPTSAASSYTPKLTMPDAAGLSNGNRDLKRDLTILHLEDLNSPQDPSHWHHENHISQYLHRHGCRVIAATDVEQAELLAGIWRPHVVLYTSPYIQFLADLKRESTLKAFPFVVLHPEVMQHLDPSLRLNVFLVPLAEVSDYHSVSTSAGIILETVRAAADLLSG